MIWFCKQLLLLPVLGAAFLASADGGGAGTPGAVFTMTNEVAGNRVLAFHRSAGGTLTPAGAFPTGGYGSGAGLGNQNGLVLHESGQWLVAVNAGSDDISLFAVNRGGLELTDRQPSGGSRPISVATRDDLVYVLNEGAAGNISGFRIGRRGKLEPIPGSTRPLGGAGTDPAQIEFHPSGRLLMVTIKDTNQLLTYSLNRDGAAGAPRVHASAGPTPFGFAFGKHGQVFVSEAAGGAPGASSASSYQVERDGSLHPVSSAVPAGGSAACWLVVTQDGRYAFTSNTASDSLSTYRIHFDGSISLLRTTFTGAGTRPLDSALTNHSRLLYVLNAGDGSLAGFRIGRDGELAPFPTGVSGLPQSANGLAAR